MQMQKRRHRQIKTRTQPPARTSEGREPVRQVLVGPQHALLSASEVLAELPAVFMKVGRVVMGIMLIVIFWGLLGPRKPTHLGLSLWEKE